MSNKLQHGPVDGPAQGSPERYRKVSRWAVASLVCGVLTLTTAFDWTLLVVPALGIGFGLLALQRIDRTPEELTGVGVAKAGMILSVGFGLLGISWLTYLWLCDTPPGYYRINYDLLQPDPADKSQQPPPEARELDGKRVFVKGYMYPGRQNSGITEFILSPSDNNCSYCVPDPKETEMIQVKLIHGIKADYRAKIRGVGGVFHIRSPDDEEKGLLYQIKADYLR